MFAAVLQGSVIDVQEEVQDYGPDIFGNPVLVIECDEEVQVGDKYDEETQKFILQNRESLICTGSEEAAQRMNEEIEVDETEK